MINIQKGLKFTSTTFAAKAEVVAVRPNENQVDVIITPTDFNAYQLTLNLNNTNLMFDLGVYKETGRDPRENVTISVI